MHALEHDVGFALRFDVNVLITGEHGVGKKSLAHRIHRHSRRAPAPFVVVRSLDGLDSADTLDRALRESSPGSTILIKEAERMSQSMQVKLLEFTQRGRTRRSTSAGSRLGNGQDVRFMTATCGDLFKLVRDRQFCEPLFYTLNPIHLTIPPLRDRPEDIPALFHHFISLDTRATTPGLSMDAWQRVMTYAWPGNVQELRAFAETLASRRVSRLLEPDDLPPLLGDVTPDGLE